MPPHAGTDGRERIAIRQMGGAALLIPFMP
jgi:hypothetical protein